MPNTILPTDEQKAASSRIEQLLGRPMTENESHLARSLAQDKTPEVIARELQGAPITDPKKSRPEHKDTADE